MKLVLKIALASTEWGTIKIGLDTPASCTVTLAGNLISSLHAFETPRSVIHTGTQRPDSILQPNSAGEGIDGCACVHLAQVPA